MVALKTFQNLSAERQQEIIRASLKEFAVKGYEQASLSEIISVLDLAKGSFYRYFDSKKSLYLFLIDHCAELRLVHDARLIPNPSEDFFELMLQHFKGKVKFDVNHPLESAFLHSVLDERNNDEITDMQFRSKAKILAVIKPVVQKQVTGKNLRKDIDVDTMSWIALQMNLSILDYLSFKHRIDFRKNIREGKPLYGISEKEMVKAAQVFLEIYKNGVSNQ
jgi:AcrR family transcriptional regulator